MILGIPFLKLLIVPHQMRFAFSIKGMTGYRNMRESPARIFGAGLISPIRGSPVTQRCHIASPLILPAKQPSPMGMTSIPVARRPHSRATSKVVDTPANGSRTCCQDFRFKFLYQLAHKPRRKALFVLKPAVHFGRFVGLIAYKLAIEPLCWPQYRLILSLETDPRRKRCHIIGFIHRRQMIV